MRILYDEEAQAIYIEVNPVSSVVSTNSTSDKVILDLDHQREVIGIEVLGIPDRPEVVVISEPDQPQDEGMNPAFYSRRNVE